MKTIFFTLLSLTLFSASTALACSVLPIDRDAAAHELAREALNHLGIDQVESAQADNFNANYLWTPMCPRGEFSEGDFTFTYDNGENLCTVSLRAVKRDIYEEVDAEKFHFSEIRSTCDLQ